MPTVGYDVSSPIYNVGTQIDSKGNVTKSTGMTKNAGKYMQSTSTSTSKSSSSNKSNSNSDADKLTKDAESRAKAQKEAEAKQKAEYEEKMRGGIRSAYEPVYGEIDRQIGQIPEMQSQYQGQIGSMSDQQKAAVEDNRAKGETKIDQYKDEEMTNSKKSLRDLESDIRNNLQAYQFYFGSRGAGDSSATGLASEAIGVGGLKSRSNILGVRDKALNDLNLKKVEVDNIANSENRKIDEWKSNKLFETVQFFQTKLDDLNKAKAGAKSEEQNAINNLIANTHADFIARARQIDDNVTQFKQSVDTWKVQRAAELEDFASKLSISSSYSSASPTKLQVIENQFGEKYAINPYTGDVVQDYSGYVSDDAKAENKGLGSYLYDAASNAATGIGNTVSNWFGD